MPQVGYDLRERVFDLRKLFVNQLVVDSVCPLPFQFVLETIDVIDREPRHCRIVIGDHDDLAPDAIDRRKDAAHFDIHHHFFHDGQMVPPLFFGIAHGYTSLPPRKH